MNRVLVALVAAAPIFGVASAAQATRVDLSDPGQFSVIPFLPTVGLFSNGPISGNVVASATCQSYTLPLTPCGLSISSLPDGSLGILTDEIELGLFDDDPAIDGFVFTETMTVNFFHPVRLFSIEFGAVDPDDDWVVKLDGTTIASDVADNPFDPLDFIGGSVPPQVSSFSVTANSLGSLTEGPDDFGLLAFTVAKVPVPAPAGFLVAALGGLGLMHRLRRRAARAQLTPA